MFRLRRTLPLILTVALLFLGISGVSASLTTPKQWTTTDLADAAIRLVNAPAATCTNSYAADGVPLD